MLIKVNATFAKSAAQKMFYMPLGNTQIVERRNSKVKSSRNVMDVTDNPQRRPQQMKSKKRLPLRLCTYTDIRRTAPLKVNTYHTHTHGHKILIS